jgi:hypothetical protein
VFVIVVVYFVIDSVRKLLDTPSYFFEISPPSSKKIITAHYIRKSPDVRYFIGNLHSNCGYLFKFFNSLQRYGKPCYVGSSHHGMALLRVADGEDGLQI